MPELPEVETVRKGLERLVVGKTIQKVQVLWPKIIEQPETPIFEASLVGETIQSIGRRGKFLIFHLDHYELISHLRMEGKYQFTKENTPIDKHTHVLFFFEDGSQLRYNDVRKFGRMTIVEKGASATYRGIMKLGQSIFIKYDKEAVLELMLEQPLLVLWIKEYIGLRPYMLYDTVRSSFDVS